MIAILVAAKIRPLMGFLVAQFRCGTFRRSRPACQCNRAPECLSPGAAGLLAALELEPNSLTCVYADGTPE